jgi:beta-galactosidase
MLRSGVCVNIYMFAGGTNFGFWNGATGTPLRHYQPITTSYEYQAALDEAGRPTPKYHRFRDVIARERGVTPPPVPASPSLIEIPSFVLGECVTLRETLETPVRCERPIPMESLGQSFGYILYRTRLRGPRSALLSFDVRDYAVIALDGTTIAFLDRRSNESGVPLTVDDAHATLDILVENGGRINYGPGLGHDRKGIPGPVRWGDDELLDWQIFSLPCDAPPHAGFTSVTTSVPAFYRGGFFLDVTGDTFLDVRSLHKGSLWVNGRNAGRFWNAGPQRSLYVPGVWLRRGYNDVIALDLHGHDDAPSIAGATSCAWAEKG